MLNTDCAGYGAANNIGQDFCDGCGANLAVQPQFTNPFDVAAGQPGEWQPFVDPHRAVAGIKRFGVMYVLGTTLKFFTRHLWLITKIVVVVVTPFEIFRAMRLAERLDWQMQAMVMVLGALCNILIAPALIYAYMKVVETGTAPGLNESYRWGLTKIWRLAICAAISAVPQILGYMMCIIPGIIVSLTLAVVYPVAILERGSTQAVLKRSKALTRGYRFEILLAWILLALLSSVLFVPARILGADAQVVPLSVAFAVVADIAEQAFTVLSLVMYLSLLRTPRRGNLLLPLPI